MKEILNGGHYPWWQVHIGWLDSGTAVFSFRGTSTMQDGLQDVKLLRRNIDYLQELYPGTRAHIGPPFPHPVLEPCAEPCPP